MSQHLPFSEGDVVELEVEHTAHFGLFCKHGSQPVMVLITDLSHIPSFNSAAQFAAPGDRIKARILWCGDENRPPHASVKAVHPGSDPWKGNWSLREGDEFSAEVVRYVEQADRCDGASGYLVALRPGAFTMLCAGEAELAAGQKVRVRVEQIEERRHAVRLTHVGRAV